ncbi:uncharacterized protein LOC111280441 [Durio zibethinus]|uniref:Uncharacterized protein LOC111280441 n=1 Tax=Durio zibethinus TaxID=66656 RepID=A0A6P5X602_DURZI|nr:uncharacterized protein LOC111280441 [Durio zibethinus]XP_022723578.1 uncharacterized protein LOC111280441 [Durio zibethinus]
MQPPNQHLRINLTELKAQLIKRLGLERSKQYFHYLNKLLSLKLSKVEFNKVCFRVLGRENVRLHNLLICSILKNACNAKVPPQPVTGHDSQQIGDVLLSPQKERSSASARLNAKFDSSSHESTITNHIVVSENVDPTSHDTWKPVQHHQEVSGKADNGRDVLLPDPEKLPLMKGSVDGFLSGDSRDQSEVLVVEDGKGSCARSSLQAPLGIPLFSGSISGAQRALPSARSARYAKSYDIGGLLDSGTLRERMQQIAALEGLGGVSVDCANILNNGLDVYLKRLIRMSIELVGTRHECFLGKNSTVKQHSYGKVVNGVSASDHNQVQNSSWDLEGINEHRSHKLISLLDFKVAMELNPQRLGEDRPLLLEKIHTHPFEE